MESQQIESYLQTLKLHLAAQCIDEQLQMCDEHYVRLEQISWDVRTKMYEIEQLREHLVTEQQTLFSHIEILER